MNTEPEPHGTDRPDAEGAPDGGAQPGRQDPAVEEERAAAEDAAEERAAATGDGEERPALPDAHPASQLAFPVVGIGASAGGLQAMKALLEHLPGDPGMAFVVVQHLDPEHESDMASLLQHSTEMRVAEAEEGMAVEANGVYVIPPGKNLAIDGGKLHLTGLGPRAERAPIDHFFRSLAESQGTNAIGIVLSGTGSGGTLGLGRIKEAAGLTMAQDPDEAEYAGMPRSAAREGVADLVLPVAELAERLARFQGTPAQVRLPSQEEAFEDGDEKALRSVFAHLKARTGRDFSSYKRSTMLRRIGRRMQVGQVEDLPAYLSYLRESDTEVQELLRDLLITVTNFFRDTEPFEALEEQILPRLFEGGPEDQVVRVWVAGCATGEEAYSVAMLLHEEAGRRERAFALQVFATDLSKDAIASARAATYPASIEADVSEQRLQRFFEEEEDSYRVRKFLRETVVFADHDLMRDPPFSRLDLITCRNLLIYLDSAAQKRVFETFHYALRPGGYLFLGSAESPGERKDLFTRVGEGHRLYRRRKGRASLPQIATVPSLAVQGPAERLAEKGGEKPTRRRADFDAVRQRLMAEYVPPSIVVNAQHDVVHVFEGGDEYLRFAIGAPTQNVFEVIRPELRAMLRAGLFRALRRGARMRSEATRVPVGGASRRVRLVVRPVLGEGDRAEEVRFAQVIFERLDAEASTEEEVAAGNGKGDDAAREQEARREDAADAASEATSEATEELWTSAEMEEELRHTQHQLRTTIEEYETSTEELKASNEELQSMNEELRSTSEELETSKEELQSMNEELSTVNQELQEKNEALGRANSDLQNLLTSTEIATLFLDRELKIRRFTPRTRELFNVIDADRERPLAHITQRFAYEGLAEDAERVMRHLAPMEREVENEDGKWFLVRIRPYRTVEDKIDGVVITFVEITKLKEAEKALREARQYAEAIVDTVREPLVVLTPDLRINSANDAFYETFEVSPERTEGRELYNLGNDQWDIPALRKLLEEVLPESRAFSDFEVTHTFEQIGQRAMLLNARQLEHMQLILLAIEDVTERREAEEALRESERRFRAMAETVPNILFTATPEGRIDYVNPRMEEVTGRAPSDVKGTTMWPGLIHPDDRAATEAAWDEAIETGAPFKARYRFRVVGAASKGEAAAGEAAAGEAAEQDAYRWHITRARPIRDESGVLVKWFGTATDIHAQVQAEEDLRQLNESLEERVAERTKQVRRLAGSLTMAEQRERQRIAEILHDDVQQLLYGAEMTARRVRRQIPSEEEEASGDDAVRSLDQIDGILEEATEAVRMLSVELSPPVLRDENLAATLQWLASHVHERYGLAVRVHLEDEPVVESRDLRTLLFRLARELLFNVIKHAGVDRADVTLRTEDGTLEVEVRDEGSGFDVKAVEEESGGYGLPSMRERLQLIGGWLEIESTPGEGTRATIRVPDGSSEDGSSEDGFGEDGFGEDGFGEVG